MLEMASLKLLHPVGMHVCTEPAAVVGEVVLVSWSNLVDPLLLNSRIG